NPITQASALLVKTFPNGDSLEIEQQKSRLVPHLQAIVRHFEQNLLNEDQQHQLTFSTLLGLLGNGYWITGHSRKQRDVLERAMIILEKHYGPNHSEV